MPRSWWPRRRRPWALEGSPRAGLPAPLLQRSHTRPVPMEWFDRAWRPHPSRRRPHRTLPKGGTGCQGSTPRRHPRRNAPPPPAVLTCQHTMHDSIRMPVMRARPTLDSPGGGAPGLRPWRAWRSYGSNRLRYADRRPSAALPRVLPICDELRAWGLGPPAGRNRPRSAAGDPEQWPLISLPDGLPAPPAAPLGPPSPSPSPSPSIHPPP